MKEKVGCVLDSDEAYAVRLSEYINSSRTFMYRIMAFTSKEALIESASRYEIELLVDGTGLDEEDVKAIGAKEYVVLSSGKEAGGNFVNRLQPVDKIIGDIVSVLGVGSIGTGSDDTKLMVVYSPSGSCGKTSLALALAECAGQKGKSLYVNLEQFGGLSGILKGSRGLSEALYQFNVNRDNYGKIMCCIDHVMDFDYFAPAVCAEDIAECTDDLLMEFLTYLIRNGNFDTIVVDADRIIKLPWKLFENADTIIMPCTGRKPEQSKIMDFERYMLLTGREKLLAKIIKTDIPTIRELVDREPDLQRITASPLMETARRCIDG